MDNNIQLSISTPIDFPVLILYGNIYNDEEEVLSSLPRCQFIRTDWGESTNNMLLIRNGNSFPRKIDVSWLSIVENKCYSIQKELTLEGTLWNSYTNVMIGLTCYGGFAIWINKYDKSILQSWKPYEADTLDSVDFEIKQLKNEVYRYYTRSDVKLKKRDLFHNHFDKYMQQFTYRYLPLYEHWNKDEEMWKKNDDLQVVSEFDYIEEVLFDGTHDKLHDGGLMNYHQAGKPKKLAVKWHIKNSEYMAYFWFEDEAIREVFDRFYGAHPDTKTDFMIRIDAEQNKYELALYRYGLKEPQVINESAYQLIVFKNKFEHFRSENYDQPRGAWIW